MPKNICVKCSGKQLDIQMLRKLVITQHLDIPTDLELDEDEKDYIREDADGRVFEMLAKGYVSGELHMLLTKNDEDHELWGGWTVDTTENWG